MVTPQAMPRLPAFFVGDDPALDFLNSIATPVDVPVDWLEDGDGLLSWLEQAHLVAPAVLEQLRSRCRPGALDRVAQQARDLREWFRGFVNEHRGRPLHPQNLPELEPLNRLLAIDESFSQIVATGGQEAGVLELRSMRRWPSPETLLLPIAHALAHLICSEDFATIKACEGPTCTLLFCDRTRNRTRRWCTMAICGNRAKQAAHRQKVKGRPAE